MVSFSPAIISSLHALADTCGLTDIQTPGIPACAPGSGNSHIPGFPANELDEGVDYIKIIADEPGFDQETLNALVVSINILVRN
jgi:hypothetical protein